MIARELTEFFAGFSPDGAPGAAARRRRRRSSRTSTPATGASAGRQIRFRDVAYSEDQAFGARPARGRLGEGLPPRRGGAARARLRRRSSSCAATSTSTAGLRETTGHVEPFGVRSRAARRARRARRRRPALDARAGRDRPAARALGGARAACTTAGGKRLLGARLARRARCPAAGARAAVARAARRTTAAADPAPAAGRRRRTHRAAQRRRRLRATPTACCATARRRCSTRSPGMAERERLHIALVVPPWRRGSGGHTTLFHLLSRLERRATCASGCTTRTGELNAPLAGRAARQIGEWFAPFAGPVFKGFDDWYGADVVMATGWQTVYPVLRLDRMPRAGLHRQRPRARVLRDLDRVALRGGHLPPRAALHRREPVAARPARSTATAPPPTRSSSASTTPSTRRGRRRAPRDTVVFYARHVDDAARGAARAAWRSRELQRRRPETRIVLFGDRPAAAHRVPLRAPRRR